MSRGFRCGLLSGSRLLLPVLGLALAAGPGIAAAAAPSPSASAIAPATPKPATAVEFLVGSQTLILTLAPGTVPTLVEASRPARLIIKIPGNALTPGRAAFGNGLVTRYEISHVAGQTLAVLSLRNALRRPPALAFVGDKVVISVVPELAPSLDRLLPASVSLPFPTARPKRVPVPTTPEGPATRITPVPMPSGTGPRPVPPDIPPIPLSLAPVAGGVG